MLNRCPKLPALAAGLLLSLSVWLAGSAPAEEPEPAEGGPSELRMHRTLASHMSRLHLGVYSGRITAVARRAGRRLESKRRSDDRRERLYIDLSKGGPKLSYELGTDELVISVEIVQGNHVTVRRQRQGDSISPELELKQRDHGPLTLTVGSGSQRRQVQGPTLWHLLLAEPEPSRKELIGLLEIVKPDWRLLETTLAIEDELFELAASSQPVDGENWHLLVEQLGSDSFSERQSAERKLRTLGKEALPFLASLDRRPLDAEQQFRVRSIIQSMAGPAGDDTPYSVAAWTLADPNIWYRLLDHPDESRRRIAAGRLTELLGQPLDYEPAAQPHERQAQLERLKARMAKLASQTTSPHGD
jgi:hypothetical protein